MVIQHVFRFKGDGESVIDSPGLGMGDIVKLKELFPLCSIWKSQLSDFDNIMLPSESEARDLYLNLVQYYCEHDLSDKSYPTGDMIQGCEIVSDLLSVFNALIDFFEETLGFKKSEEASQIISSKRKKYEERKIHKKAVFKTQVLAGFKAYPDLKAPDDSTVIDGLKTKLAEYENRLAKKCHHSELFMLVDSSYRDAVYKIEIVKALLALKEFESLNLQHFVSVAIETYGDVFNPYEYFRALSVIAHYLGTPFPGSIVEKDLPKPDEVVTAA
jgi:hypothetical protein